MLAITSMWRQTAGGVKFVAAADKVMLTSLTSDILKCVIFLQRSSFSCFNSTNKSHILTQMCKLGNIQGVLSLKNVSSITISHQ